MGFKTTAAGQPLQIRSTTFPSQVNFVTTPECCAFAFACVILVAYMSCTSLLSRSISTVLDCNQTQCYCIMHGHA